MFLVTEVILGTLTLIATVTAIIFLFIDRTLAGRFFFFATVFGVPLLVLSTIGLMGVYKPPKGLKQYYGVGLAIGNITVILANFAAFYLNLPSL